MSISLNQGFVNDTLERCLEDLIVRFIVNCPEEDLATYERVLFQIEEAHWFYLDYVTTLNPLLQSKKMKPFTRSIVKLCPVVWKWGDPEIALASFGKYKSTIPVRGCALLNQSMDKVLLVKGIESNSWGFPRGKISKDEKDVDCAIRELEEETGYDASDSIDEDIYIERTLRGKNYKIYIIKNVPDDTIFEPKAKFEIVDIQWHNLKKLNKNVKTNSGNYFLVNSMLKPIMSHINAWKNSDVDHLKKVATEQLKQLLGIGVQNEKKQTVDPGRELLSFIQNAAKKYEIEKSEISTAAATATTTTTTASVSATNDNSNISSTDIDNKTNGTSEISTNNLSINNPLLAQSQLAPFSLPPLPFMTPMPFMTPFFPPPGFGAFPFGMPPHHHPMLNGNNHISGAVAPSASSLSKPKLRSKVANSKELLSILTSKSSPKPAQGGLGNEKIKILQRQVSDSSQQQQQQQQKVAATSTGTGITINAPGSIKILKRGKESNASQLINILKRPEQTQSSNESRPETPLSTKTELPTSRESNASQLMNLLKRPQSSDPSGSAQLMNIIKSETPKSINESNASSQRMNILKRPQSSDQSSQLLNIISPSSSHETPSNGSGSAQLLNLLKNSNSPAPKAPAPVSTSNGLSQLKKPNTQEEKINNDSQQLLNLLKRSNSPAPPALALTQTPPANVNEGSSQLLNMLKRPVQLDSSVNKIDETSNGSTQLLNLLKKSMTPPTTDPAVMTACNDQSKASNNGSVQLLNILKKTEAEAEANTNPTTMAQPISIIQTQVPTSTTTTKQVNAIDESSNESDDEYEEFDDYDDNDEEGINVGLYASDSDSDSN